ncbi:alpha/beta hydrolase [Deinococcus petrolearius]|uniref:Alpha/beta hydrolase n=1 Tax=Deinococcus petrolearius TaxID=1751295 RepID=A0ABW1DE71_9DEIO
MSLQITLVLTLLGLLVPTVAGLIWHFADALVWALPVRRRVPRTRIVGLEVPPAPSAPEAEKVEITLTRNATTRRPGVLSLEWDDPQGHTFLAQLGPVTAQTRRTVTRRVEWQDGPLRVGQVVRPSTLGLGTPHSRGLAYREVGVPALHGEMPAWLVPASRDTATGGTTADWVILTHSYKGLRQDALRVLPTFAQLGLTSLTITYRNAHGAPRTPAGVYRLSAEEWEDLEAAVRYAKAQGARRIILMGFSMGASITLAFLRYSALASAVSGVILDSPPLEWRSLIRHFARRYHLRPLAGVVEWLTVVKSGQDFDAVDHHSVMHQFSTPMLLFHGSADRTVPVAHAERLAQARPDLVEYHRVEGAEHLRPWNMDPNHYEAMLRRFVQRIVPETDTQ